MRKVCLDKFQRYILPLNYLEWALQFLEIDRDREQNIGIRFLKMATISK